LSTMRVLEVVIAMTFMFYLAALLSSGLVEWLANLMKKRAKYLLRGLRALLQGNKAERGIGALTGLVAVRGQVLKEAKLYEEALRSTSRTGADLLQSVSSHPLIRALAQSKADGTVTRLPSYLPARTFVTALFDELVRDSNVIGDEVAKLRHEIESLSNEDLKKALQALLRTHGDDLDKFGKAVEGWYDDQMDRVSGAYKRWAKRWVAVIGLGVALVMHLDAIGFAAHLWNDEPARAAIVKAADEAPDCEAEKTDTKKAECIDKLVDLVASKGPPIGPQTWFDDVDDGNGWLILLGILVTGAASSLGAPFWFDALGRLNSLRNSGPKPAKSKGD
jgi:hypothetical protein